MNYVTVNLPRSGLAHSFESYSRAFLYYARKEALFVHPNWFKIRLGPYLRGEKDKRNYWKYIKTPEEWGVPYIYNLKRLTYKIVSEENFDPKKDRQFLIIKDGGCHSFLKLDLYKQEFLKCLESISKNKPNKIIRNSPTVGIFHRSGDFKNSENFNLKSKRQKRINNYGYIDPLYAAEALQKCRKIAGWDVPAILSTDADIDEVKPILKLGNVVLNNNSSALANILEMSSNDVLIMGTSAYGHWSFFLGNSFGIFPGTNSLVSGIPALGLKNRNSAWFIFDNETSLNDSSKKTLLRNLLNKGL